MREDNRAIVRAASQATKAADFILGFLPSEHALHNIPVDAVEGSAA